MSDRLYHVDGELVPADEATVSVRDRGFMYGDAAFETIRVYGGTPFEWDAHATRLARTCETLGFADAIPHSGDLRTRVDETLAANELSDATVKLSVTRGVQTGKLTPDEQVDPTVVITAAPLPRGGTTGDRAWDEPATIRIADTRRAPDTAIPTNAKTHNYLNGILARLELRGTSADETIMRSMDGWLTEGATSNLCFVADGVLYTPSTDLPLLPGVTRDVVLDCAREAGVTVETGRYEPSDLRDATEVFLTNSTWEIRPVSALDGTEFGVGSVTETLQRRFDERVDALYEA